MVVAKTVLLLTQQVVYGNRPVLRTFSNILTAVLPMSVSPYLKQF